MHGIYSGCVVMDMYSEIMAGLQGKILCFIQKPYPQTAPLKNLAILRCIS